MPRQKLGPRVNGPYFDAPTGKYKLRVYTSYADKGTDHYFDTDKAARHHMSVMQRQLNAPTRRRVGRLLEQYIAEKEQTGLAKPQTCKVQLQALLAFFASCLEEDVARLTPKSAAEMYKESIAVPKLNGIARQPATHRLYLALAKGFCQWVVRKEILQNNPFNEVIPIGRVSAGKKQLRVEEARHYAETAFRLFDEKGDKMALASVVPLYLGLRASEVLKRQVRDVDAGGSLLWIDGGKTKNARRHLKIEAKGLQARLLVLTHNRTPEEPLFGYGETGKPRLYTALWITTQRICKAAGVPLVCPHSFRGLWATLSVESGAASSAVAASLGHGSFAMTARHYAQPEAVANARSARVVDMLSLDGNSNQDMGLSPEQIIERLSPSALAKLAEILYKTVPVASRKGSVAV